MTRAFELQCWLRENGPATQAEIKEAGFTNFSGLTRDRMMKHGAIEAWQGPNPHSEKPHARIVTTMYAATEKDYTPKRGNPRRTLFTPEQREAAATARAINRLRALGYRVEPPV